jgi:hypothetical protein
LTQQFQALKNAEKELGFPYFEFLEKLPKKAQFSGFHNVPAPPYPTWLNDLKILHELTPNTLEILPMLNKVWLDFSVFTELVDELHSLIDCQKKYKNTFGFTFLAYSKIERVESTLFFIV